MNRVEYKINLILDTGMPNQLRHRIFISTGKYSGTYATLPMAILAGSFAFIDLSHDPSNKM